MISTKKMISIMVGLVYIVFSFFVLTNVDSYVELCKISSILIVIYSVFIFFHSKNKFTPMNIIYICFILFQFGLPFLYAIDNTYSNWNISQFSEQNLVWSIKYTTICIEFFGLGILISNKNSKTVVSSKSKILSNDNSQTIYNVAKILLAITAPICFALGIYVAYLAHIHGYNYIKVDSMGIYNSATRICQEMIIPALLLLIIYSSNKIEQNKYMILSLFYTIVLIFTGARTTSLALILVILLIKYDTNDGKTKIHNKIFLIIGVFLIISIGTFVAQYRFHGSSETFSFSTVINNVVEEMGFNFTSLPFTRIFIPVTKNYGYGLSYIYSIICLIPRTLDPFGFIESIHQFAPERWLADVLHIRYGKTFDYGVGYSVIAESYFNFGEFGFISIFIQSMIINKLLNFETDNKFKKYIKYIMLFSLITYPRRSFETLIKSIEYNIVLVIIIIYIFSYKKVKK